MEENVQKLRKRGVRGHRDVGAYVSADEEAESWTSIISENAFLKGSTKSKRCIFRGKDQRRETLSRRGCKVCRFYFAVPLGEQILRLPRWSPRNYYRQLWRRGSVFRTDPLQGLASSRTVSARVALQVSKKLMFPLCRTCADTIQQSPCTHSDDERAFVGTWVSEELKLAKKKGYTVTQVSIFFMYIF